MPIKIRSVEAIVVSLPRDTPYPGPRGAHQAGDKNRYFVRKGNPTIK